MDAFFKQLETKEKFKIKAAHPLFGGSINKVYRIDTTEGERVIKTNNAHQFPGMFKAEREGLDTLRKTQSIGIPKVYTDDQIEGVAYLIMEYLPKGNETRVFWNTFAHKLAQLHQNTHSHFGFKNSNYIGSLKQENKFETTAGGFYVQQRIKPQIELAERNGYTFKHKEDTLNNIKNAIPNEPPALIHGDLWSGNYLASENDMPYLIDPAVSYGSREMDIAMMQLFGGFPKAVFLKYNEIFPLEKHYESRTELWQLYYLLVHLNLFGSGYLNQVTQILKKYT